MKRSKLRKACVGGVTLETGGNCDLHLEGGRLLRVTPGLQRPWPLWLWGPGGAGARVGAQTRIAVWRSV